MRWDRISEEEYLKLCFYAGDIEKVKSASRNPGGSLGWSGKFIRYGLRLILLLLYDETSPSMAANSVAAYVGFRDETSVGRTGKGVAAGDASWNLDFEKEIIEESQEKRMTIFWNYFQRWKRYSAPITADRESLYFWARDIVSDRADAIVSGKYSKKYGEVAALLALAAEVGESMGVESSKMDTFAKHKKKYPRHTSFQREMKTYFGVDK